MNHANIALRFLPQASYELSASLVINPIPARVVRIFMLWKGVPASEEQRWASDMFQTRLSDQGGWASIVGSKVSTNLALSLKFYEWGGMEVK